jgi:hypothetical protein
MNGRPEENPSMSMTATFGCLSDRITSPLDLAFTFVSAMPPRIVSRHLVLMVSY